MAGPLHESKPLNICALRDRLCVKVGSDSTPPVGSIDIMDSFDLGISLLSLIQHSRSMQLKENARKHVKTIHVNIQINSECLRFQIQFTVP